MRKHSINTIISVQDTILSSDETNKSCKSLHTTSTVKSQSDAHVHPNSTSTSTKNNIQQVPVSDPTIALHSNQITSHDSDVTMKVLETKPEKVTASPEEKKHIFFAYAEQDESDIKVAETLKDYFVQRRLRVYHPRENEDINTKIANGIKNAAVVIVLPSHSLQISKTGSKLLNYADQTKTPILNIRIYENFQPKDWLGAILAPTKTVSTDFNELMKSLMSMGIRTNNLVLERDEKNEPQPIAKQLFHGGTGSGNVTATYHQSGQEFPMEFEFLGLEQGKVFGQGDDHFGAFTITGEYNLQDGYGDINMHKQYVGKHSVIYRGKISFEGITCTIEGNWEMGNIFDRFFIYLTLPEVYATKIEKVSSPKALRRQGNKVMISYCPCQYDLAQKITAGLISKGIPTICPPLRMYEMIKIATEEAKVIVPLMSEAYEASNMSKYVLSYADEAGIPIVPVKAQYPYSQSGWLGVICAGALYTKIAVENDIEKRLDNLVAQLHPYIKDSVHEEQLIDSLVDGTLAQGYYIQWGEEFDMKFDMFAMSNGYISGQGEDVIGGFVINGKYTCLSDEEDFEFQFKKHYIGKHDVEYSGIITQNESQFFFDGNWYIGNLSDSFHLEVPRKQSSGHKGLHIMLSYEWNNQELVKRVADMLKQRNIPIWFDIAGDMKGNINTAMANGVEGAAAVISFDTVAYSKSINCQKELTYASQLKKNIVPVLLENDTEFENTWLGMIIASLNRINMQDDNQFHSTIDTLVQQLNKFLEEKNDEESHRSEVITRFEGGAVEGKYYQYNQAFDMFFDFFSLREGRVSGQGNDAIGPFTMAGNYDNEGKVSFTKQYVGQHAVEYDGNIYCDNLGGFQIKGNWSIKNLTDEFYLESVNTSKPDVPTENI
ncbi:unnamed protein product [Adineta steineri]|uniref:TIR domain-containing protein n=1 Tax=Adineta steineri TaxID=433720 RepID=A0A814RC43_9BILA|nr:unnamed protein product [Adineta steineri]CAF1342909.1 unnamed protein product [Adineta steineri]